METAPKRARRDDDAMDEGANTSGGAANLRFEDPFEDEIEVEDGASSSKAQAPALTSSNGAADGNTSKQMFIPGVDQLQDGEQLEYDNSTYQMYHKLKLEWPCLSFDFIRDDLGQRRGKFPHQCTIVAGTQADATSKNKLLVLGLKDMHKTRNDDRDSDEEWSDDENALDDDPVLESRSVKHTGGVNRVRSMPQKPGIVASWADTGRVYLWDLTQLVTNVSRPKNRPPVAQSNDKMMPIHCFKGHKDEGYAMDWSPVVQGKLATGDCKKYIHTWTVGEAGCAVDDVPFKGHEESVEDIQWSPSEGTVFASCSVDQTVRIWDTRQKQNSMLRVKAHDTDVNVISWNSKVSYLLASGSDDGSFKVWDLRNFKEGKTLGDFSWHKAPVSSIAWHPTDESVLAVGVANDQISVWDLALEDDQEHARATAGLSEQVVGSSGQAVDVPPQLLFLHCGQRDPKEIRFHPQIPGMIGSTAFNGFDAWICEPLIPQGSNKR